MQRERSVTPEPAGVSKSAPLRVAIRIDRDRLSGWQARLLEKFAEAVDIESLLTLVVSLPPPTDRVQFGSAADRLDGRLAQWRYRRHWQNWSIEPEAVPTGETALPSTRVIETPEAVDGLTGRVDLVIDLAAAPLPDWWREVAEVDTLSLVDGRGTRAGDPAFARAEVLADATMTRADVLLHGSGEPQPKCVATMVVATFRYSWTEQRRRLLAKASPLLVDAALALRAGRRLPAAEPVAVPPVVAAAPRLRDSARLIGRGLARMARHRLVDNQWGLVITGDVTRIPNGETLATLPRLSPPAGSYWADPFIVEWEGETRIFFEVFVHHSGRAHIASGRLEDGHLEDVRTAIAPDYHVSFPFVFEHAGGLFMLPEACESGALTLWRCERFPDHWVPHRVLLHGVSAADAALFRHDGRWWMLTNIDRSGFGEHGEELHAYYADDPIEGPWQPHPANPLVTDARTARMGGGIFTTADGRLLRPAQKGGDVYGSGLQLMEITRLDFTGYSERPATAPFDRVSALPDVHHCHVTEQITVLDHCRRRIRGLGRSTAFFGRNRRVAETSPLPAATQSDRFQSSLARSSLRSVFRILP